MSDLLLSSDKVARFERQIERHINSEFGVSVDVLVQNTGKVYVYKQGSDVETPEIIQNEYSTLADSLCTLDISKGKSPYKLLRKDEDDVLGCSFRIERDGW